jgi:hypothetical protein
VALDRAAVAECRGAVQFRLAKTGRDGGIEGHAGPTGVDGLAQAAERASASVESIGKGFASIGLEPELLVDVAGELVSVPC